MPRLERQLLALVFALGQRRRGQNENQGKLGKLHAAIQS